jgi:hypothetical protein
MGKQGILFSSGTSRVDPSRQSKFNQRTYNKNVRTDKSHATDRLLKFTFIPGKMYGKGVLAAATRQAGR